MYTFCHIFDTNVQKSTDACKHTSILSFNFPTHVTFYNKLKFWIISLKQSTTS